MTTSSIGGAERLVRLLAPHAFTDLPTVEGTGRFIDTPPAVVREALTLVDERWADIRPNGQPPARWLVELAERREGLLGGTWSTQPWSGLRVDAIQVPRTVAADLARAVVDAWAPYDDWPAAIDLADAEGWPSWDAVRSEWQGPGRALMGELPELEVFGLWWD